MAILDPPSWISWILEKPSKTAEIDQEVINLTQKYSKIVKFTSKK